MKNLHLLCAISFVLLNLLIYWGIEWIVWIFLVPLVIFAVCCTLRTILLTGSLAVLLVSYLWSWWLNFYTIPALIIGLSTLFLYFLSFIILINFLFRSGRFLPKLIHEVPTEKNNYEPAKIPSIFLVLIPPTLWFCIQKLTSYTMIGSSWIDLAMFQPAMAPLIRLVGAKGITFIIVLFNSTIAGCILQKSWKLLCTCIMLLIVIWSCTVFSNSAPLEGTTVKVALLQGNFPQSWEWRREHADKAIIDTYLALTRNVLQEKPDIIVWPEYAIPDDIYSRKDLFEKINTLAQSTQTYIVLGTLIELNGVINDEKKIQNVAALISPQPEIVPHDKYVSVRPVPFEKCTIPGIRIHTVETNKHKLGIMLCFEELVPDIAAELSRQGAEFYLSLANNSHFNQTKSLELISLQTRLRAAETGKYLARVTNTGITQFVNPYGIVTAQAQPFSQQILTAEVTLSNRITHYSRYGDKTLILLLCTVWFSIVLATRKQSHFYR